MARRNPTRTLSRVTTSRRFLVPFVIVGAVLALTSCDAFTVMRVAEAKGIVLTSAQAESVANHVRSRTLNCYEAVGRVWPAEFTAWATKIVKRESGGDPTAKNRGSSASGCFQMLKVHAARFTRLGFTWSDRFVATVNVTVALDLFCEQGSDPWVLTNGGGPAAPTPAVRRAVCTRVRPQLNPPVFV